MVENINLYSSDMVVYKKEVSEEFIKIYSEEENNITN